MDYCGLSWFVGDLKTYHVDSLICGCTLTFVVCCIALSYAVLSYLICANVDLCGLSWTIADYRGFVHACDLCGCVFFFVGRRAVFAELAMVCQHQGPTTQALTGTAVCKLRQSKKQSLEQVLSNINPPCKIWPAHSLS